MDNKKIRTFKGATSIVTGGASGIGRALSEALAGRGSEVVIADMQVELAGEVAAGIVKKGGKATAVALDVSDFPSVEKVIKDTARRTGRLDYIFNNAGIGIGGPVSLHSIDDWNKTIDVNLKGVVNGVHSAYELMCAQGFGHIVNTASTAGLGAVPGITPYAATKHAVVGLSRSLRIEAAEHKVRVSVICPGLVRTPIMDGGKYGKILMDVPADEIREFAERLWPMDPAVFAEKVLDRVARDQGIIIVPVWWRLLWWIDRLSPAIGEALARFSYRRVQSEIGRRGGLK